MALSIGTNDSALCAASQAASSIAARGYGSLNGEAVQRKTYQFCVR